MICINACLPKCDGECIRVLKMINAYLVMSAKWLCGYVCDDECICGCDAGQSCTLGRILCSVYEIQLFRNVCCKQRQLKLGLFTCCFTSSCVLLLKHIHIMLLHKFWVIYKYDIIKLVIYCSNMGFVMWCFCEYTQESVWTCDFTVSNQSLQASSCVCMFSHIWKLWAKL